MSRLAFLTLLVGMQLSYAWTPGEETTWLGLSADTPLKVYLPSDYDPEQTWPLIYCFHGTGGRASTGLFQGYTEGRGFVLVAAPYAIPGEASLSREGVLAEIRRIRKVHSLLLGESVRLDQRIFVGGFSKGGWMSDLLATEDFETLAGALILGAGRIPDDVGRALARERAASEKRLSIYIGIGQLDANHLYSRRAEDHYRQAGHEVVFEEYLTKGHQPGEANTPYLKQWLHSHAMSEETLQTEAQAWWDARLAAADAISSPIERLLYLEHLQAAPFAMHIDSEKRAALSKTLERAQQHRSLQGEMDARRAYARVQVEEEQFKNSTELPKLADSFHRLFTRSPETYFGQRAGLDLRRLEKNYQVLRRSRGDADPSDAFPRLPVEIESLTTRFAHMDRLQRGSG